jgi:hypothetical protein
MRVQTILFVHRIGYLAVIVNFQLDSFRKSRIKTDPGQEARCKILSGTGSGKQIKEL